MRQYDAPDSGPCNEIDLAITIRRALEQKDLEAKSRELLEVTKRQSVLIEEARMLRRLRDLPRKDRSALATKGEKFVDRRELLEQIDDEIRKGKEVLKDVRNGHHDRDEVEGSRAPSSLRQDSARFT